MVQILGRRKDRGRAVQISFSSMTYISTFRREKMLGEKIRIKNKISFEKKLK